MLILFTQGLTVVDASTFTQRTHEELSCSVWEKKTKQCESEHHPCEPFHQFSSNCVSEEIKSWSEKLSKGVGSTLLWRSKRLESCSHAKSFLTKIWFHVRNLLCRASVLSHRRNGSSRRGAERVNTSAVIVYEHHYKEKPPRDTYTAAFNLTFCISDRFTPHDEEKIKMRGQ